VYLRDEGSSSEITITVQVLQAGITTDQFADTQTKLGSNQTFVSYEKNSTREMVLAALPAWEIIETWKMLENDFHHKGAEYFLVSGGRGYSIYTQSERSEWDVIKPAIDQIVASFTIDMSVSSALPTATQTPTPVPTATPVSTGTGVQFGPVDGNLDHNPDSGFIPTYSSGVALRNAVVEATFVPPHYDTRPWSSGFMLRRPGVNEQHIVVIISTGYWYHYIREGTTASETVSSGYSPHIATSQGKTNHIRVIALEDVGWLFINGNYIAELDLSGGPEAGDVMVIGSWWANHTYAGETTGFSGFTVRSLQTVYGPEEGAIEHEPGGSIDTHSSTAWLADAVVEARFHNPYPTNDGGWSPGFLLRSSEYNALHIIGIASSGYWYHDVGTGTIESRKDMQYTFSKHIVTDPSGSNSLRVIALGDEGWFFINGAYVAELDLSGWSVPGQIIAMANYFTGHGVTGKSTNFDGFVVWSVGDE
jgi:hypothetical protein